MKLFKRNYSKLNQSGDTIVEVMVSISVLALVLTATFTLSNRSFQHGIDAGERKQAVSYANEQVEFLKLASSTAGFSSGGKFYSSSPYCITIDTTSGLQINTNPASDAICKKNNQYNVQVQYNSTSTPKNFKITASWTSSGGNPNKLDYYYRPSGIQD